MSIKVPDGWKTANLEQMLISIQRIGKPLLEKAVEGIVADELRSRWFKTPEQIDAFAALDKKKQAQQIWWDVYRALSERFQAAHGKIHRDSDDFSLGLNIFLYQGTAYFYTWCGLGIRFDWDALLKQIPEAEEFAFWDNTDDRVEGVSLEDWKKRGPIWNRVLDLPLLQLPLITPSNFGRYSLITRERLDPFLDQMPAILASARLHLEAEAVLKNERHLGQVHCREKYCRLMAEAGDRMPPFFFDWMWRMTEEAERNRATTPQSSDAPSGAATEAENASTGNTTTQGSN